MRSIKKPPKNSEDGKEKNKFKEREEETEIKV